MHDIMQNQVENETNERKTLIDEIIEFAVCTSKTKYEIRRSIINKIWIASSKSTDYDLCWLRDGVWILHNSISKRLR